MSSNDNGMQPPVAVSPFKGMLVPKLNLSGVPSGGGWALGEQVQLVPPMEQQIAQGMSIYTTSKNNNGGGKGSSSSAAGAKGEGSKPGDGQPDDGAGDLGPAATQAVASTVEEDGSAATEAASGGGVGSDATPQKQDNDNGGDAGDASPGDPAAAAAATTAPSPAAQQPQQRPPPPPRRAGQKPTSPAATAAVVPAGSGSTPTSGTPGQPLVSMVTLPPQLTTLPASTGAYNASGTGSSLGSPAAATAMMGANPNNINTVMSGGGAGGLMMTSGVNVKQPGDSVNVHALVADADLPALLAAQQQQALFGDDGEDGGMSSSSGGGGRGGPLMSSAGTKVVRSVAHDHNNRLLWVAAATETAIVGYSLLGSSLEVRHRVGTDGYFATALCVTVAPPQQPHHHHGASSFASPPAKNPQRAGSIGGGAAVAGEDVAGGGGGTASLESSAGTGVNSTSNFARQRAMIDAGSDILWVGMQDGSIVPISLFFFSERNDRIAFPLGASINSNGGGGGGGAYYSTPAPPVESLVGGPNGNLWALHRRSLRAGGGVIALLWDTVQLGRLVASLELITSPGRCFVAPSKSGQFLWSATHVADSDACSVRCWQEGGVHTSGSTNATTSAAAAAVDQIRKPRAAEPALFLNTFGSVSCLQAFQMGGAEYALLGGEGGLLVLCHNSDNGGDGGNTTSSPPTTRAPRGFDSMQVSSFELVPYTSSESPLQLQHLSASAAAAATGSSVSSSPAAGANTSTTSTNSSSQQQQQQHQQPQQQQPSTSQHILVVAAGFFAPHELVGGIGASGGAGAASGGGGGGGGGGPPRSASETPTQPEAYAFGEFPRIAILRLSLEPDDRSLCISSAEGAVSAGAGGGGAGSRRSSGAGAASSSLLAPTLSLIRVGFEYYYQPSIVTVISRPRSYQGAETIKMLGVVVHSELQEEEDDDDERRGGAGAGGAETVGSGNRGGAGGAPSSAADGPNADELAASRRRPPPVLATSITLVALQPTVDEGEWGIPGFIMRASAASASVAAAAAASAGAAGGSFASGSTVAPGSGFYGRSAYASGGGSGTGSGNANVRSAAGTMREDGSLANHSFSDHRGHYPPPPPQQPQQQHHMMGSPGSPTPTNNNSGPLPPGASSSSLMQVMKQTPTNTDGGYGFRERSLPAGSGAQPRGGRIIGSAGGFVPLGPTPRNEDGESMPRRYSRSPASTPASGAANRGGGGYSIPPIPPGRMTPRSAAAFAAATQQQQQQQQSRGASQPASGHPAPPLPHHHQQQQFHRDAALGGSGGGLAAAALLQQQHNNQLLLEAKLDTILKRVSPDASVLAVASDLSRLYKSIAAACSTVAAASPPTSRARLAALEAPECVEQLAGLALSGEAEFSEYHTHEIRSLRHLLRTLSAVALNKLSTSAVKQKRSVACQTSNAFVDERSAGNNFDRLAALLLSSSPSSQQHQQHQQFHLAAAASHAHQSTVAALESQLKDAVARYEVMVKAWKSLEQFVDHTIRGQAPPVFARMEPADWLCPTSRLPERMNERLALLSSMWVPPEESLFHERQQLQQLQAQLQRLRTEVSLMHAAAARSDQLLLSSTAADSAVMGGMLCSTSAGASGTFLGASAIDMAASVGRRRGHSAVHRAPGGHASSPSPSKAEGGGSQHGRTLSGVSDVTSPSTAKGERRDSDQHPAAAAAADGGAKSDSNNSPISHVTQQLCAAFMESFKKRQLPSSASQKLHVAVADISTSLGAAIRLSERADLLAMAASVGNSNVDAVSVVMTLRSHIINSLAIPHRGLGKLNEKTHTNFFRAELALLFRQTGISAATAPSSPTSKSGSSSVPDSLNASMIGGEGSGGGGGGNNSKEELELIAGYFDGVLQRPHPSTDARQTTLSMRGVGVKWLLIHLYATMRVFAALCNQSTVAASSGGMHREERDLLAAQLKGGEYVQRCTVLQDFFSTLAVVAVDTSTELARRVVDFTGRALAIASEMSATVVAAQSSSSSSATGGERQGRAGSVGSAHGGAAPAATSASANNSSNSGGAAVTAALSSVAGALNNDVLSLMTQIRDVIRSEAAAQAAAAAAAAAQQPQQQLGSGRSSNKGGGTTSSAASVTSNG